MMGTIRVKIMTEDALNYLRKNAKTIVRKINDNPSNSWVFSEFPQPVFQEKKYEIEDFELIENPNSVDLTNEILNSIRLYEHCKNLPRFLLCDERFWLWLQFDKCYSVARTLITLESETTLLNMWTHEQGVRRGLMFGVLSRCFFRVALTVDDSQLDKYELTRWIIQSPSRFREFSWRTYSSEQHITRGSIKGMRRAFEIFGKEKNIYTQVAKYVSRIGGIQLLDVISEEDIEEMVYQKTLSLLNEN